MAELANRLAPHSKQSEMMVLGCMLTQVSGLNVAADGLDETDFYFTEHRILFSVLKSLYKKDKPADVHLVCEELRRQNRLDAVGGVAYVTALAQFVGTSAYTEEYVELVRNKSLLRKMIQASQRAEKIAADEPEDVHAALDEAQQLFFAISQSANPVAGTQISELLSGVKNRSQEPYLKELQERQELFQKRGPEDAGITGVPTHFNDLDRLINGLGESNLMILAARPAMGKTALALNIAEHVCFKSRIPVGIFSLEMTAEQLLHRIVCSQSQVESDKIRTGAIDGLEFQRIVQSVNQMMGHTMLIDDQPGLKITDLRARARRMREAHRIELLIIDYLQLISGSGSNRSIESRQNEISEISRMLKTLARELNIPIVCLSQLSRRVEDRVGHRPMMSDLRESGCITGDSQLIDAASGKEVTIQELAERTVQKPIWVWAMDRGFKPRPHRLIKAFFSGVKEVFELRTSSGRRIEASANHRFFRWGHWVRLDQLGLGDLIAIGSPNGWRHARELSESEAQLEPDTYAMSLFPSVPLAIVTRAQGRGVRSGPIPAVMQPLAVWRHSQRPLPQRQDTQRGLLYDTITSIRPMGEKPVYDATVENVHNFMANGIIVHNSIEQDADVVMFLLRREYYDPMDKPGLAELIVAKNRHGRVGNVQLTYRKEFAQFANYAAPAYSEDNLPPNPAFEELMR